MSLSSLEYKIKETRDSNNLYYILENEQFFFETGYKVIQNQEKNGFIKCLKLYHNGKIKLVYDISRFKDLLTRLQELTPENFLAIISRLFAVVLEVKHNGFIQCMNIEIDLDKIFIDSNNLNVYLIYLPIITETKNHSMDIFEKTLKNNLLNSISGNNGLLSNDIIRRLYDDLQNDNYHLENVNEQMKKYISSKINSENSKIKDIPQKENSEIFHQAPSNEKQQPEKKKKSFGNLLKSLMGGNKQMGNIKSLENVIFTPINEGGVTEILDNNVLKQGITLVGVDTPVEIQININKPEFILGKNSEAVDGVIDFNKAVSRVHCKIINNNNSFVITDMGSLNGTYVNSVRIQQGEKVHIHTGDIIKLANTKFIVK